MRITSASTTACPKITRLPSWLVPDNTYYFGVDTLILVAMGRDWILKRSVHPVYLYGLPALVLGQASVMWIAKRRPTNHQLRADTSKTSC